jgi:hypothetical protein
LENSGGRISPLQQLLNPQNHPNSNQSAEGEVNEDALRRKCEDGLLLMTFTNYGMGKSTFSEN